VADSDNTPSPRGALDASARLLHPSAPRLETLDSDVLTAIASGLGSVVGHEHELPGVVRRERLLATAGYDAWLMVWGPRSVAESHDHAGSVSVVNVVAGALTESVSDIDGAGTLERTIIRGATATLPATGSHTLSNRGGRSAVSVHVYSPPLGDDD
jgi:predicted metal-dependent enzyme (double-stranded beta helix superfamily)